MPIEISIPPLGWSSDDAVFAGWIKPDGSSIVPGEAIYNLETEKSTQEVESLDGGVLHILPTGPAVGDRLPVGTVIGYVLVPGEKPPTAESGTVSKAEQSTSGATVPGIAASSGTERGSADVAVHDGAGQLVSAQSPADNGSADDGAKSKNSEATTTNKLTADRPVTQPSNAATLGGPVNTKRPVASPRARHTAAKLGVDWTQLSGSGSTGRIRECDVLAAANTPTQAPADLVPTTNVDSDLTPEIVERIPVNAVRRTIADRMMLSSKSTAPVTLTSTTDATNLVNLRTQFQVAAGTTGGLVPSYTDFLLKLTARALAEHPALNARWNDDHILVYKQIHLGIAVDTPAGLVVPVVRDVAQLGLAALAERTRDLIDRARRRKLLLTEMQEGTFTVSNLGGFGIDAFTPIINHPQAAVLGVGRIRREPAAIDNQVVLRDLLTLSLTFDHRIVDGAPAARFLQTLCEYVRNPGPQLIG